MKVLIVGGGGREHALAWRLSHSPGVRRLVAAPGNAGIAALADCVPVRADDIEGIVGLAAVESADLVVVGPETPLVAGLADRLRSVGIAVFGPNAAAARIEGSKAWAKELMRRGGIPTARWETFTEVGPARASARAGPVRGWRETLGTGSTDSDRPPALDAAGNG